METDTDGQQPEKVKSMFEKPQRACLSQHNGLG